MRWRVEGGGSPGDQLGVGNLRLGGVTFNSVAAGQHFNHYEYRFLDIGQWLGEFCEGMPVLFAEHSLSLRTSITF